MDMLPKRSWLYDVCKSYVINYNLLVIYLSILMLFDILEWLGYDTKHCIQYLFELEVIN